LGKAGSIGLCPKIAAYVRIARVVDVISFLLRNIPFVVVNRSIKIKVLCVVEEVVVDEVWAVVAGIPNVDSVARVIPYFGIVYGVGVGKREVNSIQVRIRGDVGKGVGVGGPPNPDPPEAVGMGYYVGKGVGVGREYLDSILVGISNDIG